MEKQEFLERFNKKTQQELQRGFCEIDGKKYYCLTNNGSYFHAFANCDSFTYFIFLKAFYEMAKSIGEECVNPEFINVRSKNGVVKGDIVLDDFSRGEQKLQVFLESIDDNFEEGIPLEEQMKRFKNL